MQTKEIIKVLSAFSKKEAIDFKEKNVDSSQWKQFDYSQEIDFDKFDYRIQNDRLPIFQKAYTYQQSCQYHLNRFILN